MEKFSDEVRSFLLKRILVLLELSYQSLNENLKKFSEQGFKGKTSDSIEKSNYVIESLSHFYHYLSSNKKVRVIDLVIISRQIKEFIELQASPVPLHFLKNITLQNPFQISSVFISTKPPIKEQDVKLETKLLNSQTKEYYAMDESIDKIYKKEINKLIKAVKSKANERYIPKNVTLSTTLYRILKCLEIPVSEIFEAELIEFLDHFSWDNYLKTIVHFNGSETRPDFVWSCELPHEKKERQQRELERRKSEKRARQQAQLQLAQQTLKKQEKKVRKQEGQNQLALQKALQKQE